MHVRFVEAMALPGTERAARVKRSVRIFCLDFILSKLLDVDSLPDITLESSFWRFFCAPLDSDFSSIYATKTLAIVCLSPTVYCSMEPEKVVTLAKNFPDVLITLLSRMDKEERQKILNDFKDNSPIAFKAWYSPEVENYLNIMGKQ